MGGALPERPADAAPSFLVWADKDPSTAHLDRVQIVKGWVDAEGVSAERIYDVAASGERSVDPETGLYPPVGNTVNVPNASYENTIGAAHLEAVWTDPDFDPAQPAFYYVRVLEIPTPRMSTYDAKTLGIDAPEPASIQERAATSAIWYGWHQIAAMQPGRSRADSFSGRVNSGEESALKISRSGPGLLLRERDGASARLRRWW